MTNPAQAQGEIVYNADGSVLSVDIDGTLWTLDELRILITLAAKIQAGAAIQILVFDFDNRDTNDNTSDITSAA